MSIEIGDIVRINKGIKIEELRKGCTSKNWSFQLKDSYLVGMSALNSLEVSEVTDEYVTVRATFVEYSLWGARPIKRDLTVTREFFENNFSLVKVKV